MLSLLDQAESKLEAAVRASGRLARLASGPKNQKRGIARDGHPAATGWLVA